MRVTTTMLAITAATSITVMGHTSASAQVAAPGPETFGARGQAVVTSELALDYQHDSIEIEGADDVTVSRFDFHAGFDRVMAARLTLGVRIGFAGEVSGVDTRKGFDIGARVGYLVPVVGTQVVWPTVGFVYGLTSVADRDSTATIRTVTFVASAHYLFQPARHVIIGAGPTYSRDLQSKTGPDADQTAPKVSGFGFHGIIGLWF